MVAMIGRTWDGHGWRLAPALRVLIHEVNARHPGRSTASDGSIASAAHSVANPTSDHEADRTDGYVKALDLTDNPPLFDPDDFFDTVIARRDPRVKYIIKDGRIWRSYSKPGLPAWTPQTYRGTNGHWNHAHLSVTAAGARDTTTWFPDQEDDDMPLTDADVARIAEAVQHKLVVEDTRWIDWRLSMGVVEPITAATRDTVYTARNSIASLIRRITGTPSDLGGDAQHEADATTGARFQKAIGDK